MSLHTSMVTFVMPWYLSTKTIIQISILCIFPSWQRSSVCTQHEGSPGSPRIFKPFQLKILCTYQIMTSSSLPNPSKPSTIDNCYISVYEFHTQNISTFHRHLQCIHTRKLLKGPHHKEHYGIALRAIKGYLETVQLDISSEFGRQ